MEIVRVAGFAMTAGLLRLRLYGACSPEAGMGLHWRQASCSCSWP